MMNRSVFVLAVFLVVAASRVSFADGARGRRLTMDVCGTGFIRMPLRRGGRSVLRLPGTRHHEMLWGTGGRHLDLQGDIANNLVRVTVLPDAPGGVLLGGMFMTDTNVLGVIFEVVDDSERFVAEVVARDVTDNRKACADADARARQEMAAWQALQAKQVYDMTAEHQRTIRELEAERAEKERRIRELEAKEAAQDARLRVIESEKLALSGDMQRIIDKVRHEELLRPRQVIPIDDHAPADAAIAIRGTSLVVSRGQHHLVVEVRNGHTAPFVLDGLRLLDPRTRHDHTGLVTIIEPLHPDGTMKLAPDETVQAILEIKGYASLGSTVAVAAYEAGNLRNPVYRDGIPIIDLTPSPDENVGKKSLGVEVAVGGTWVPSGGDRAWRNGEVLNDLAPTIGKMLGLRFQRGLTAMLNLEVMVALASTGEARFEDVTLADGRQGDYLRSATIGSVRSGLRMRFDAGWYRPYLHLGLGVQVANYDAKLDRGDAVEDAPGGDFGFAGLGYFGGGMDIPLGPMALEFGARYVHIFAAMGMAFEASLGLGYSWK